MDDLISRQAAIDRAVPIELFGEEVMVVAVSELKQLPAAQPEPCEDAVSRADVIKLFATHDGKWLYKAIQELPFVTPKQRKGKWIKCGWAIKCSECDYDMPYTVRNFCPNCGAKMEVTE